MEGPCDNEVEGSCSRIVALFDEASLGLSGGKQVSPIIQPTAVVVLLGSLLPKFPDQVFLGLGQDLSFCERGFT